MVFSTDQWAFKPLVQSHN
jgi:hypothetical protein